MSTKLVAALVFSALIAGIPHSSSAEDLIASFSGMSATKFSLEAIAPKDVIRPYAICKAVWFAEKMKAQHLSLSDPVYGDPKDDPKFLIPIPPGWITLKTTAYVTDPNPSGNPTVSIAEFAPKCRKTWDWYR